MKCILASSNTNASEFNYYIAFNIALKKATLKFCTTNKIFVYIAFEVYAHKRTVFGSRGLDHVLFNSWKTFGYFIQSLWVFHSKSSVEEEFRK